MLVDKLSVNDIRLIDDYRKNYAFSNEANSTCGNFMDTLYILREWDLQKSQFLYKLFGEQLTISKHFTYMKSYEQLQEEIANFTDRRYGRAERSGAEFSRAYFEMLYPSYYQTHYEFSEAAKTGMCRLMSDDCLIYNKYDEETFEIDLPNGNKLRVNNGAKTSKMLGKIAAAFNLPGYEDFRICHSQVLNQKNLGGTLTLSIHPLDYMTMSDNECGWESCMSWRDEGGYRQGTVEMMNSNCVLVAYLTSEYDMKMWPSNGIDRDNDNDIWNNKKWRQLFLANEDLIISVKDYPYRNDELTRLVVEWIKDLAKENLGIDYKEPEKYLYGTTRIKVDSLPEEKNGFKLEVMTNHMYNDFGCCEHQWLCVNANLNPDHVERSSYRNFGHMFVRYSGKSECMVCGTLSADFEDESCLACYECQDKEHCDCCGEAIHGESIYIDGMTLCSYCYDSRTFTCAHCDKTHYEDNMIPIFVIPRLTAEELTELDKSYRDNHPGDYHYNAKNGSYDEVMYWQENTEIWVCGSDEWCLQQWVKRNLIEGHSLHRREMRWRSDYYVYYDELTHDAQDAWCWGFDGDNEAYKRKFVYYPVYPSWFITDDKAEEDDLPF